MDTKWCLQINDYHCLVLIIFQHSTVVWFTFSFDIAEMKPACLWILHVKQTYFEDKEYDIHPLVHLSGMLYVNIVLCFSN